MGMMQLGTTVRRIIGGMATLAAMASVGCGPTLMAPLPAASGVQGLGYTKSNLEMIVEPEAGPAPIVNAITSAKKSVHMKMYMMTEPTIINALATAARKLKTGKGGKPAVQVLMEHWVYDMSDPDNIKKIFNVRNEDAAKQLQAAGVEVKWSKNKDDQGSPEWFNLTHEKSFVIDAGEPHQVAWIMTANMTNSAFTKNREYLLVNKNKDEIDYVEACFQADWAGTPFRTLGPNMVVSPAMGKFANNSRAQVIRILESAQKSLTVQMEVFNDPDTMQTLGMMVKRGVDVRLTLSHQEPRKPGEAQPDDLMVKQLAGFGVTNVKFARQIGMHAKAIVADGARAYVGSINLTRGSMDKNRELGMLTDNPTIVRTLVSCEAKDFAGASPAPGGAAAPTLGRGVPLTPKASWAFNDNLGS
jgi:phosphatidylserine/phosphatidylglycerophosphate/cardiolipin synthase-like enzyme